ncbi:MAG TPA: acetate kinase [Elusimicrobiota bacterium]|nr:acetate kinase [Elusimicrobiota bacterium]
MKSQNVKVLIINAGSSSLKYSVLECPGATPLAKGIAERLNTATACFNHRKGDQKWTWDIPSANHGDAIRKMLNVLTGANTGVITNTSELQAVGHRIVHGGKYSGPAVVTDEVVTDIESYAIYAPLHNRAAAVGIRLMREMLPHSLHMTVFDTSFHRTIPPHAHLYGVQYELAQKLGIRRYGFHGSSHQYVAERTAELMKKPLDSIKIITCHLGAGSSITAIDRGRSVDTSMGMTPLEGVVMGTRTGSMDPAIVELLMKHENISIDQIDEFMNRKNGLQGLSGISSDMRDIVEAAQKGHPRAKLTLDIHNYQVRKYIGSYHFILGGVDAITFTAGIGENSDYCRAEICKDMDFLKTKLDPEKNKAIRGEGFINTKDSKIKLLVVPTNEELIITRVLWDNLQKS